MASKWAIRYWPKCECHVFLSHCREDYDTLVRPVFEELENRRLIPWLDRHHYPLGRDAFQSLREELLKCRHVAYFITPAALEQGRGWMAAERAFAELIQRQLVYGDEISHVELPLLLAPQNNPEFQRSAWRALIDKAQIPKNPSVASNSVVGWSASHVQWCADTIERFVLQEERWAIDLAERLVQDPLLARHLRGEPNRMQRIVAESPQKFEFS